MENFVSIALLLIVKVAEPPQTLPVRLPPTPRGSPDLYPTLGLRGGSGTAARLSRIARHREIG